MPALWIHAVTNPLNIFADSNESAHGRNPSPRTPKATQPRGVSILLVAGALVFIMAMAALAIDLGTLYVVRSEMQRAADAAALAAARAFADSGITSGSGLDLSAAQSAAQNYALLVLASSPVGGRVLGGPGEIVISFPGEGNVSNPQVRVALQRSDLPLFFGRIWGHQMQEVFAAATAEAYNPSGNSAPVLSSVKPWAMPNCDPTHLGDNPFICSGYAHFVDSDTGLLVHSDVIGTIMTFHEATSGTGAPPGVYFNLVPSYNPTSSVCPAVNNAPACVFPLSTPNYQDAIQCSTNQTYSCGNTMTLAPLVPETPYMVAGAECLMHATNFGLQQGQDAFFWQPDRVPPVRIAAGANNPNPNVRGSEITSSDSVITVPMFGAGPTRDVVGFLQLGLIQVCDTGADACGNLSEPAFQAMVLNVAGCGSTIGTTSVSGSSAGPVAVRLVADSSVTP